MPSRPTKDNVDNTIPIGMVFVTVGFIILLGVLAVWWITLHQIPVQSSDRVVRIPNSTEISIMPSLVNAISVTPTQATIDQNDETKVVLPESPVDADHLPSFSTVADAPSFYTGMNYAQPERLVIPSLGVDARIRKVSVKPVEKGEQRYYQWQVPRGYEVGWHENSALLGQPGNTVLNGHNNIYGEIFRDLIDLEIGDEIVLYDSTNSFTYRVTQQEILPENGQPLEVRFENARWIKPTQDERITIVTCYPYTTNSHRLVVIAKPATRAGS